MRGTAYSCRKDFCRGDERGSVWTKIEEELSEDVESEQVFLRKMLPCETQDAEYYGQDGEPGDLNRFATKFVDSEDGEPVAREGAGADEHDLAGGGVAEVHVEAVALLKAHYGHERGRTEAQAVKCKVEKTRGWSVGDVLRWGWG